jgi:hypothetical protein
MSRGKVNKLTCTSCGTDKNPTDFYVSNSPFHKHTNKLHVCKDCFWDFVGDDTNKLKLALRMIDKPFLINLLNSSIEEAEKSDKNTNPIKNYMKNVSMPQYKNLTWDDSDFDGFKSSKSINTKQQINEEIDDSFELTKEEIKYLKTFWGSFDLDDLIWLQNEYEDWTNRYECDSKGMETLIQEICLTKLDVKTRRANGEKVDQQLKTLQDLLGSSNLKPVQETGANAVEQETFGTLIKKFENEKPIPEADEKWQDVDNIGKYIRVFFLGHLTRMLGLKNDYENEYWDEVTKYTVEEPIEEDEETDNG